MTRETAVKNNELVAVAVEMMVPVVPVTPAKEIIEAVRQDSQSDPQAYLDETVVPFGGE